MIVIARSVSDAAVVSIHKKISCMNLMPTDLTTERSEKASGSPFAKVNIINSHHHDGWYNPA